MKVMVLLLALVLVCQTFAIDDMDSRTNLWYGSDIGRAPIDDMLEELNSKPMSMSMQEYRAIQATNQTPVLADVIASNIAHAVESRAPRQPRPASRRSASVFEAANSAHTVSAK